MKVIDHLIAVQKSKIPSFSFEIVPPQRGRSVEDLIQIVSSLQKFSPAWIDVTAHSSTVYYSEASDGTIVKRSKKKRPGTIGICGVIQNRFGIDTVAHILCEGFTREETEDALIELNYLGIHNILALKGDKKDHAKALPNYKTSNTYAYQLVEQIVKLKAGNYIEEIENSKPLDFCIGVAGYPEKHFESPNEQLDIAYLKQKVDAGAEYIVTQMFFDNHAFFSFYEKCRNAGIQVPIVPGLKVIKSLQQLKSLASNFYINIPESLTKEIMKNPENTAHIGKEWASKQVGELIERGHKSVHFYLMNDTETVIDVMSNYK